MHRLAHQQLLLALLRRDEDAVACLVHGAGDAEWNALLTEANRQRVTGLVYDRLQAGGFLAGATSTVQLEFARRAQQGAHRMLRLHVELASVLDGLAEARVPVVVLKGAGLATRFYRNIALRDMGDLDLLVPADRLADADVVLTALGYRAEDVLDVDAILTLAHHLPRYIKSGAGSVEVHWTLTFPGRVPLFDVSDLWRRAVPMQVVGRETRSLCSEDLLLHLCVHASYHHMFGFGIRSLYDIAMVLSGSAADFNWNMFQSLVRASRTDRGAFLALDLSRRLVGARVPGEVLDALRPAQFDPGLLEAAEQQVFAAPEYLRRVGGEISRLAGAQSWHSRWQHVRTRLFVSRQELAWMFSREPTMSRLEQGFWYGVRLGDLVRRYGRVAGQLVQGRQPVLTETALRHQQLRTWLTS